MSELGPGQRGPLINRFVICLYDSLGKLWGIPSEKEKEEDALREVIDEWDDKFYFKTVGYVTPIILDTVRIYSVKKQSNSAYIKIIEEYKLDKVSIPYQNGKTG